MSIKVLCAIYADFANWEELHMHQRWLTVTCWAFFVTLAFGTTGCAQISEPDLKREIEILKKNQEELQKEVEALKALIQGNRPSRPNIRGIEFELGNNDVQGESSALLTLVEFTDYE